MKSAGLNATVLLLFCAILVSTSAYASDNKSEAKEHFEKGHLHYKLGRFEEALAEYSKAYELDMLPEFLFNIGQCHRKLDNHKQAIFFFAGYLREKSSAKNVELVEALIDEAEYKLKEQEEKLRRQEEVARQSEEERLFAEKKAKREATANALKMTTTLPRDSSGLLASTEIVKSSPFYKKWWFWTIVGGALAAAAGGTIYAVSSGNRTVLPSGSVDTLDFRGL